MKFNDPGIFSYSDSGFDIKLTEGSYSIKWNDIERLQAYKTDLLTYDEICINITFDNKTIIITEETKGWYQFIEKIKSVLQLTNDNWEALVVEHPFEYDLTTIYERADRKMPPKSNFYSVIKNKTQHEINSAFQQQGWSILKSSMTDFEISNSWTALVLQNDGDSLLLHGLVAYHPDNVNKIRLLFDSLKCAYTFEFYDNDQLVEQTQNGM